MTSTTHETITEWSDAVNTTAALADALGVGPCEALHMAFPAIVGDDETMGALAALLEPVMDALAPFVVGGIVSPDDGETFVHNVFHLLQISAGLGHMLGVSEAIGVPDVPADLSDIAWASLPDTFGESDEDEGRQGDA